MLAAWIAYKMDIVEFPAYYLRDYCGVQYTHIRRTLPENMNYLVELAVELVNRPPLLHK